jgi:hypothetical protein
MCAFPNSRSVERAHARLKTLFKTSRWGRVFALAPLQNTSQGLAAVVKNAKSHL